MLIIKYEIKMTSATSLATDINIENDAILAITIIIVLMLTTILVLMISFIIWGDKIKKFFLKIFFFKAKKKRDSKIMSDFISTLTGSLLRLSKDKIGALIVIENKNSLSSYINIGNKMESPFNLELVVSIFYNKLSPLHDGAMIIQNWKIVSLSSYLPMTKKLVSVEYGARHRAAIGICEQYDCFSFVVSETSGTISSVHGNIMKKLSLVPNNLAAQITEIFESNFNITNSEKPLGDSHIDEKLIVSSKRKTK